uniref:Uncharacterized protein n=1 Tax=Zea mays TaxID=4577 RepID=C4J810_MAIZE|nr:unknown [Zea mays]
MERIGNQLGQQFLGRLSSISIQISSQLLPLVPCHLSRRRCRAFEPSGALGRYHSIRWPLPRRHHP